MPRLHYLTEQHAHDLVISLTEQVFPDTPAFQLRGDEGRNALLSALAQPCWPHYRTLPEKAGALHFSLNKNHPFADGNKRFALTAMEVFLFMNRALLVASAAEAEAFALGVAEGSISREDSIAFVRRRTLRADWTGRTRERWATRLPSGERDAVLAELRAPTSRLMLLEFDEAGS